LADAQRLADRHGGSGSIDIEIQLTKQPRRRTSAKRRTEFPGHLPRVRTAIEVAEQDRVCSGAPMEPALHAPCAKLQLSHERELQRWAS
jgi:hypothetical protein